MWYQLNPSVTFFWVPPKTPPVVVCGTPVMTLLSRSMTLYRAATSKAPHPGAPA
jgi:hypothetical protein